MVLGKNTARFLDFLFDRFEKVFLEALGIEVIPCFILVGICLGNAISDKASTPGMVRYAKASHLLRKRVKVLMIQRYEILLAMVNQDLRKGGNQTYANPCFSFGNWRTSEWGGWRAEFVEAHGLVSLFFYSF